VTEQPALSLRGITRTFGGVVAVHDVDLDLPPGARRALLGPNGAGKTTLVNLIAGALPPSSGTIELFGVDVTKESGRRRVSRGLARTYQQSKTFDGISVLGNIELALLGAQGGVWRGLPGGRRHRDRLRRVHELATEVGLGDLTAAAAGALSHGGRRQLEIAMGLAADPRLLVLDEPAAGLSPSERETLRDLLLGLDPSLTVLLIEHDMNIALTVADSVTVMADGKVVFEGTPAETQASSNVHDIYLGNVHA
jgi:branched-chain amino acid transport system ATP-binding protein